MYLNDHLSRLTVNMEGDLPAIAFQQGKCAGAAARPANDRRPLGRGETLFSLGQVLEQEPATSRREVVVDADCFRAGKMAGVTAQEKSLEPQGKSLWEAKENGKGDTSS